MLKKLILIVAIFLAILLVLTLGESVFREMLSFVAAVVDAFARNFSAMLGSALKYLQNHSGKVVLALVLTLPASLWVLRQHRGEPGQPATQRRIAIVLALLLGWLGIHRFYLGQIAWGMGFLVLAWIFIPVTVILGLVDALRYFLMDDETFGLTQTRQAP